MIPTKKLPLQLGQKISRERLCVRCVHAFKYSIAAPVRPLPPAPMGLNAGRREDVRCPSRRRGDGAGSRCPVDGFVVRKEIKVHGTEQRSTAISSPTAPGRSTTSPPRRSVMRAVRGAARVGRSSPWSIGWKARARTSGKRIELVALIRRGWLGEGRAPSVKVGSYGSPLASGSSKTHNSHILPFPICPKD